MSTTPRRVAGRRAIVFGGGVTGGTGLGNGKASAILLAREGAVVAVADVVMEHAQDCCEAIRSEGGTALALECDVADPFSVADTVERSKAAFGGIDILVNNVGISSGAGLFSQDEADWDHVFAVNVRGILTASKNVIPMMLENQYGRIVNIGSTAALRVTSGVPSYAYGASKAAVIHLTRSIAMEFASKGIRANCVIPGMIDTPHAAAAIRKRSSSEEADRINSARDRASPTGKQGTAWDVAQCVLFLSEEEVNYINGAELIVDGGFTTSTPRW